MVLGLLKKKRFYIILLLPLGLALSKIATFFPWIVEKYYSTTIFSWISRIFGRFFGWIPISIAELLILTTIIVVFFWLGRTIWCLIRKKGKRKEVLASFIATLGCSIGCITFAFVMLSGLNYARPSFATLYNIQPDLYSAEELTALCEELVVDINRYAESVSTENGRMIHSANSYYTLSQQAKESFSALGADYPLLGGFVPRTKPVIFSRAMSYAQITGVYFPFTFECNVNIDHPDDSIPFTMMHEISHFKGFMRENEANFIAYLACEQSTNPDFLYSGSLSAFIYAGNALSRTDNKAYWALREQLCDIAKNDLQYSSEYWAQFETPIATISDAINDTYLKINHQEQGVKSYGEVVDLLLYHFKKQGRI